MQSPYMDQVYNPHQVFDVSTMENFSGGYGFTPLPIFDQAPEPVIRETLSLEYYYKCTWCGWETTDRERTSWCGGCGANREWLFLARQPQVVEDVGVPPGMVVLPDMNEAQAEVFREAWLAALT